VPEPRLGPIASVRVEGNEHIDSRIVAARARIEPGETLSTDKLRRAIRRVHGLNTFQAIRFRLEEHPEGSDLVLRVKEKPWGPTYLHFGLEAEDDFEGTATYGGKMNLTRTDLNARGAEWRNDVRLGSRPYLRTELFQPLDFEGWLFVAPWARLERQRQALYDDEGHRFAEYEVDIRGIQLDFGAQYGRYGEVRVGSYRGLIDAQVDTGSADLPTVDVDAGGVALDASYDTLDSPSIPRDGAAARLRARFSRDRFGADDSYDRVELAVYRFLARGRHCTFGRLNVGTNLGSEIPAYDEFLLGGLFSLAGYSEGELRGQSRGGASLGYHYLVTGLPSGLGKGVYAGGSVDAANVWESADDIAFDDLRYGVSIFVGADTALGPLYLAYGSAEGGRNRVYFVLGRPF
jgi:NTE family protein